MNSDERARLKFENANREPQSARGNLYSPFNIAGLFMIQTRQRAVLAALQRHGLDQLRSANILEVGCGRGGILTEFLGYGSSVRRLTGIDLLPERLQDAVDRLRLPLVCADAQRLPFPSNSFDVVLQFTVFSSILDNVIRTNAAQEMLRVVRQSGFIIWYDFWVNPTNPATRGIRPGEIRKLFPKCHYDFQLITLAPPVARFLVPFSWLAAGWLEKIKFSNTHYLVVIRPINSI